jgi:two-component system, LuxR family, sensor kinase FixL
MTIQPPQNQYHEILSDPTRLAIIHDLDLTDSPAEEIFDRLTRLAARLIPTPVALVSIVDDERQFFKSIVGLAEPWASMRQTPLTHSFCQHVVVSGEPLIVENAPEHPLVKDNLAIPDLSVISYLGMPLTTKQGITLGSFCVIDTEARQWSDDDIETVRELARSIMTEIELRNELIMTKTAKEEQQKANKQLEYLLASSPAVIYTSKAEGDFGATYISPNVSQQLGYDPSQFIEDPNFWSSNIHPEDAPLVFSQLEKLFEHDRHSHEYRFRHSDGVYYWMHDELKLVRDVDGNPLEIVGFWSNIIERKQLEGELRDREEHLRSTLSSLDDLVFALDKEGVFIDYYQPTSLPDLYIPPEVFIGNSFKDVLPPHIVSLMDDAINAVIENNEVQQIDYQLVIGDVAHWFNAKISTRRDANDEFDGVTIVARNITERKQADLALLESELRFKTLFDITPIAIFTKDTESRYTSINADGATYWSENPIGRTDADLLPPEIADDLRTADLQVMETGQQFNLEEQLITPSGVRTVLSRKVPLRDAGDNITGILGISLDITERTQLLEKLQATNQDLADFAYIVSHDLKAPLRGISSIADWLSTDYVDVLDEDGQELLALLQKRVQRLQGFIEGILKYSRVGRVDEEWEEVDLQDVVDNVTSSLSPPENIQVVIDGHLPIVYGSVTRLEQVFQNLLSNAIKFMDKPQGKIAINSAKTDGYWEFRISDNGPGIEERHFDKIFQIFQTLTPRDEFESTGIGLTLIKKIVELHGGTISVKSEVGTGTEFIFTIADKRNE